MHCRKARCYALQNPERPNATPCKTRSALAHCPEDGRRRPACADLNSTALLAPTQHATSTTVDGGRRPVMMTAVASPPLASTATRSTLCFADGRPGLRGQALSHPRARAAPLPRNLGDHLFRRISPEISERLAQFDTARGGPSATRPPAPLPTPTLPAGKTQSARHAVLRQCPDIRHHLLHPHPGPSVGRWALPRHKTELGAVGTRKARNNRFCVTTSPHLDAGAGLQAGSRRSERCHHLRLGTPRPSKADQPITLCVQDATGNSAMPRSTGPPNTRCSGRRFTAFETRPQCSAGIHLVQETRAAPLSSNPLGGATSLLGLLTKLSAPRSPCFNRPSASPLRLRDPCTVYLPSPSSLRPSSSLPRLGH